MVSNNIENPALNEKDLILLLKEGKQEAFLQLFRKYHAKLVNIAYGITLDREESLDIVQDVFLKIHGNIKSFEGKSKLFTWMRRITVNESLNWRRMWKRRFRWRHVSLEKEGPGDGAEFVTYETGPETAYIKKELEKILYQGLNELSEVERTILMLKELEGLSYNEISEIMKIKKGTVSSRLFYAREKLKQSLSKVLDE